MSYEAFVTSVTMKAGEDLSAKQFFFVKVSAKDTVVKCGAGELAMGVLQDKPASGEWGNVAVSGIVMVSANGSFDAGDFVASDSGGEAVEAATTAHILGIAMAAGADGAIVPILLKSAGKLAHS
jgi:hypothetical protein